MNLIELQPDDVLVLTVAEALSPAQRTELALEVGKDFGPGRRLVILHSGTRVDVIRCIASADAYQTDQDAAQRTIWRQEYNALPPADREAYGGFAGFVEAQGGVDPYASRDEESPALPPHVWLYRNMLTEQRAVAPLGRDETNGQYAVAIGDLTDAQRAIPHVAKQLEPQP